VLLNKDELHFTAARVTMILCNAFNTRAFQVESMIHPFYDRSFYFDILLANRNRNRIIESLCFCCWWKKGNGFLVCFFLFLLLLADFESIIWCICCVSLMPGASTRFHSMGDRENVWNINFMADRGSPSSRTSSFHQLFIRNMMQHRNCIFMYYNMS